LENGAVSASAGDSRRLTLAAAQERLNEARANLNRTKSAQAEQLKEARVNLQKITSSREEQLEEARANLDKIVSGKAEQVNEAKATLERIAEVRPSDVRASEAELKQAQAALKTALANLEKAYVKAPRDAQVLKIHTRPGELIAPEGIAELGDTSQMYAVAEVYESDVSKVRLNQPVRVANDSLGGELRGTVERIGLQVKKQNVINTDPSANIDSRVVEVRVRLDADSSKKVAGLTNLQVKVQIEL
jgi:HlyD family secretion protein